MARPKKTAQPPAPAQTAQQAPPKPVLPPPVADPYADPEFNGRDHYAQPVKMKIALRAGVETYLEELQERLKDLKDQKTRTIYEIPLKISGEVYQKLLEDTIRRAKKNPNWNERDHLEMLVLLRCAGVLTPSGNKA